MKNTSVFHEKNVTSRKKIYKGKMYFAITGKFDLYFYFLTVSKTNFNV